MSSSCIWCSDLKMTSVSSAAEQLKCMRDRINLLRFKKNTNYLCQETRNPKLRFRDRDLREDTVTDTHR